MQEKKNDQIKNYIVIGLAVVFLLVGYFRFVHKKVTHDAGPNPSTAPVAGLQVPQVDAKTRPDARTGKVQVAEPLRKDLIDIFAPVKRPVKAESQPAKKEPSKPVPSFTLGGTIVGGNKPIAIINDQLVWTGDWIGEYKIVKIAKNEVLLRSGNHQTVLYVLGSGKK
jgi:hypothetical protein